MRPQVDAASSRHQIINLAFHLSQVVQTFVGHARRFCYEVMLSGYACQRCGGALTMVRDSRCRCTRCGVELDPTLAFQRCTACGGKLRLRISRYECRACQRDVPSRFVFDGPVFDRDYFRERMAESRERIAQRREALQEKLAASRSEPIEAPAADLASVPGLLEALNGLVGTQDLAVWLPLCKGFDLNRYQEHLQRHIGRRPVDFDDIPALDANPRLDRIWRFVAVVFMAHARLIEVEQDGRDILLRRKDEADQ